LTNKIKKNILTTILIAAVLYLGFTIYADFNKVISAFARFDWMLLPLLLLLSFLNYICRFLKWDYYLKILKVPLGFIDSFTIFMSGFIMSVTPGKMGELMKAFLVKQVTKESVSKVAPVIIGAYVFHYGRLIVIGTGLFWVLLAIIISQRNLSLKIIDWLGKIKLLSKYHDKMMTAYESSFAMIKPLPLFYTISISFFSWFFECFAYYLILMNFNLNISVLWATFVYTFSIIAGAITMLPGGLGVTEGSLTYLMIRSQVPANVAVSSTFIVRVVTLWFAIFIGILSVSFYQKKFGKIAFESNGNQI
jgi:uncharacterized membrane protein YbhN (UPF0104 family)